MTESISNRREFGAAVVARTGKLSKQPAPLAAAIARFKRAHSAYEGAAAEVDKALAARDKLLAVLSIADAGVDHAVIKLSVKLVGAEMTPAKSPLKGFTRFSPSELIEMKYSDEYREVARLLENVEAAAVIEKAVAAAVRDVKGKLAGADKALGALDGPQTRVTEALHTRESLVAEWEGGLHSLRVQGGAAWETTPAKLKALLAPVSASQQGSKQRVTRRVPKPRKKVAPAPK